MRKLTAKEIKKLKPGDKVLTPAGCEVEFIKESPEVYAYSVMFPGRDKPSNVLSLHVEEPKKI